MKLSDNHVHTSFSADSDTPMEAMIREGIKKGLSSICFTDHTDFLFPKERYQMEFEFDVDRYFMTVRQFQEKYPDFPIYTGIELGLKNDVLAMNQALTKKYPFDFVIGSTHLVDNIDPYYEDYWEAHGEENGIRHYYEVTLENVNNSFDYDVYGHIDYVIRYCPTIKKAREQQEINESYYTHSLEKNKKIIQEILSTLIQKKKGIEINTGGYKYGLGHPNPHETILSWYKELGGKIVTIGSDAHETTFLAYDFNKLPGLLKSCGFDHYTVFRRRIPQSISLL